MLVEIPDRMVTGWLTVVRLDRLLVLPLLGMRTFTRLEVLPEEILRGELLRIELLRDEILLRLEDLGVIVLVGALVTDRDEVVDLEDIDRLGEDCRLLDAEEDLEACWLLELLLDRLLLLEDFAKTGSMVSIRAKINVPTKILTFLWFFSVAIILLLKYLMYKHIHSRLLLYLLKALKLKTVTGILYKKSLFFRFFYGKTGG